jgi:hypothetical protein
MVQLGTGPKLHRLHRPTQFARFGNSRWGHRRLAVSTPVASVGQTDPAKRFAELQAVRETAADNIALRTSAITRQCGSFKGYRTILS